MKRMGTIGLTLAAVILFTSVTNAGIFNRNRGFRYSGNRSVATYRYHNGKVVKPGERVEGHTEATGTGTAIDGK